MGIALKHQLQLDWYPIVETTRRRERDGPPSLAFLDMRDPELPKFQMGVICTIFVIAAVTGIAQCERDPDTWRINADAPGTIARLGATHHARTIFVSSDAVEIAPHTVYAMQKAHAETQVLAAGGAVLRPSRIPADRYDEVADDLIQIAEHWSAYQGRIVRWVA